MKIFEAKGPVSLLREGLCIPSRGAEWRREELGGRAAAVPDKSLWLEGDLDGPDQVGKDQSVDKGCHSAVANFTFYNGMDASFDKWLYS